MKPRNFIRTALVIVVGIVAVGVIVGASSNKSTAIADEQSAAKGPKQATNPDGGFSPYVDKDGKISLPKGYKQKWSHLGNWAVAKKPGKTVHEMHDVYTQPETIVAFNKTGEFPDGAVLVKEVRETKADQLTTGHSAWSTDIKIWFVMIKDRKERFEDSDHWGDGWGWALFEAKDPSKNVSAGYDTSCLGCHVPAEDSDWVYVYGYPALRKHKQE
jgi:hypothetical protein